MFNRRTAQPLAGMLLVLLGLAGSAAAQDPQAQPTPQYSATLKVGDQAPAFKLPASDGNTYSLSDFKGKTIVLAWFPKAFTGG
jgi:cytochrome oxidase Cu insertion factor (SCO1/SenC/PrrC family)